jgi:hypothetical protein
MLSEESTELSPMHGTIRIDFLAMSLLVRIEAKKNMLD